MRSKEQILLRWYEEVWINADFNQIRDLYKPVSKDECLSPGGAIPPHEICELVNVFNNLISDQRVRIIHSIEKGTWISALVEMFGFRAGTDEPLYLQWLTMMRIEDGRIVESYRSIDFLSLFEQLGQLPDNAFELLLSGTSFK